jgi:hypothetical protein
MEAKTLQQCRRSNIMNMLDKRDATRSSLEARLYVNTWRQKREVKGPGDSTIYVSMNKLKLWQGVRRKLIHVMEGRLDSAGVQIMARRRTVNRSAGGSGI